MAGTFGGRASVGQMGEIRTAKALALLCRDDGPTVLHDLRLPMRKITANIDHLVVSGKTVTILDSKSWRPGRIWTFGGVTRRGWQKFPSGDKRTLPMARTAIAALLDAHGLDYTMHTPVMVVWPSNNSKRMRLRLFKPVGATALTGRRFTVGMKRMLGGEPADPRIVAVLAPLVIASRPAQPVDDDPFA